MPPRPRHHATRAPLKLRSRGARNWPPSSAIESGLPRVWPRHRAQEEGDVGDGPGHRARHRQRRPAARVAGHAPRRRTQADDVAEGRRIAQRAPHVAPVRDRDHAARQGHRSAAAAAAARPGHVVGIACRPEDAVEGLRAGAELRGIRLAAGDRAGRADTRHDRCVPVRHVVAVERRAARRADSRGIDQILVRHRQAVQDADCFIAGQAFVRAGRVGHRALRRESDDGVDLRIDAFDACQMSGHDLAGREVLAAHPGDQFDGAQIADLLRHRGSRLRRRFLSYACKVGECTCDSRHPQCLPERAPGHRHGRRQQ